MPKQYQLLHTLSKSLFLDGDFKLAAIVSKTPYLSALVACHGARVEISPPYIQGACFLLPRDDDPSLYAHAVIDEIEDRNGQILYYYKHRKNRAATFYHDRSGKPASYIEKHGKFFPHKAPKDWLGKHDVTFAEIETLSNSSFPAIIGHDAKAKLDYWNQIPLGIPTAPELTMSGLLNISSPNSKLSNLNTYSPRSFNYNRFETQIWINDVPENIKQGRFLIILSPTHNRYQDLIVQVNNLYAENKLTPITNQNTLSALTKLGITNRALLVATLMQESTS